MKPVHLPIAKYEMPIISTASIAQMYTSQQWPQTQLIETTHMISWLPVISLGGNSGKLLAYVVGLHLEQTYNNFKSNCCYETNHFSLLNK